MGLIRSALTLAAVVSDRLLSQATDAAQPIPVRLLSLSSCLALAPLILLRLLVFFYRAEHELPEATRRPPTQGGMISKFGGVSIHSRIWRTNARSRKGIVFIVHGFAEHIGRYDGFVTDELMRAGYDVAGIDHQGHGRSGGDFGYFRRWVHLRDDFLDFMERILQEESPRPAHVFLLGHSMGGGLACEIARSARETLSGVILSAPLIMPDPKIATPLLVAISGVLSSWLPKLPVSKLDAKDISKDPAEVLSYTSDPLVYHGGIRARVGEQLLEMMGDITSNAHMDKFPVLLLHGTADKITDPAGSAKYLGLTGAKDKALVPLEGLYHEILNEPEKQQVMRVILKWLDDRASR